MANNVPVTAGSGTTLATDDVSTVHYQRVKLTDGTEDSTTPIVVTTPLEGTGDNVPISGALAAGIGPGFDRRDNPANLGTAANSTSVFDVNGAQTVTVTIATSQSGTFTIEGTYDGTNWIALNAYSTGNSTPQWMTISADSPNAGWTYIVQSTGLRSIRLRTVTTLGATVSHFFTGSLGLHPAIQSAIAGGIGGGNSNGNDSAVLGAPRGPSGIGVTTPMPLANYGLNGTNWDRLRTSAALEGTGDNVPVTGVLAAGIGPGWDRRDNPSNLGTVVGNTSTFDVNGCGMVRLGINTTTTGTFTIEATADNTNWVACEVYDAGADLRVTGASLTPTVGKAYIVTAAGYRQIRLRTVTTLGATMAHFFTGTVAEALQEVKVVPYLGPIPGISSVSFTASTTQTSANMVAGTSGQRIYVTSFAIGTGGTTAGRVSLYWGTGAFTNGTSPTLFDGEFAPSATVRPGATQPFTYPMGGNSATGDNLRITTSAGITVYVTIGYYKA